MSLQIYLKRDVFERLYNTPTMASRMQRYNGTLPEGCASPSHVLFGSPHELSPVSGKGKVWTPQKRTPSRIPSLGKSPLPRVATIPRTPSSKQTRLPTPSGRMGGATPPHNRPSAIYQSTTPRLSSPPPHRRGIPTYRRKLQWKPRRTLDSKIPLTSSGTTTAQRHVSPAKPSPRTSRIASLKHNHNQQQHQRQEIPRYSPSPRVERKHGGSLERFGPTVSTPPAAAKTPPHRVNNDRTLSSLESSLAKLKSLPQFPTWDEARITFDCVDVKSKGSLSLPKIREVIRTVYPSFDQISVALDAYQNLYPDTLVDAPQFHFLLCFLGYFRQLWDDFIFFDEDDLRISKGEFYPVAETLDLFDNVDEVFSVLVQDDYITFDSFCVQCAQQRIVKLHGQERSMFFAEDSIEDASVPHNNIKLRIEIPEEQTEPQETLIELFTDETHECSLPSIDEMLDISNPPSSLQAEALFRELDSERKGLISMEEINKGIEQRYTALRYQYLAMTTYQSLASDSNRLVDSREFFYFLIFCTYFNRLSTEFSFVHENNMRINKEDFVTLAARLEFLDDPDATFEGLDSNQEGSVCFGEICALCAQVKLHRPQAEPSPHNNNCKDIDDRNDLSEMTDELNEIQIPSAEELMDLFDRIDVNGNGILSLAELDKYITEQRPEWNRKPAIMRAYRATDRDNDGYICRSEFPFFCSYIVYFNKFWDGFAAIDEDSDRRISKDEFMKISSYLDGDLNAEQVFEEMDINGGGYVLFDEFCAYCTKQKLILNRKVNNGIKPNEKEKTTGTSETVFVVPDQVREIPIPPRDELLRIFDSMDMNGNGRLSLAEIDKYVVEHRPQWNSKPVLLRAYRSADRDGDGFITRSEFPYLYRFLAHYITLWKSFASLDVNGDRRLSRTEFIQAATDIGLDENIEQAFDEMDANGGGYILFEEFCVFCTNKKITFNRLQEEKPERTSASKKFAPETNPEAVPFDSASTLPSDELLRIFDLMDVNGNGILSLAEIDKFIVEHRPDWNNKPAIMRAYRAADFNNDGFVSRDEFPSLMRFIDYYNIAWDFFATIDEDSDRRISKVEFMKATRKLDLNIDSELAFAEIDVNGGGYILFNEFCAFFAKYKMALENLITAKDLPGSMHIPSKICIPTEEEEYLIQYTDFFVDLQLPSEEELIKIFDAIDVNGNCILSLAELDKHIEQWRPEWNKKSAIMRAYKAADRNKDGYIVRSEFPFFYRYIICYSSLWDAFIAADRDGDRRVSKQEFSRMLRSLDPSIDVNVAFALADSNGGGYILFDEFCAFITKHKLAMLRAEDFTARDEPIPEIMEMHSPAKVMTKEITELPSMDQFLDIAKPVSEEARQIFFENIDIRQNGSVLTEEAYTRIVELYPALGRLTNAIQSYQLCNPTETGYIDAFSCYDLAQYLALFHCLWGEFFVYKHSSSHFISARDGAVVAERFGLDAEAVLGELKTTDDGMIGFHALCAYCVNYKNGISDNAIVSDIDIEYTTKDGHPVSIPSEDEQLQLFDNIDIHGRRMVTHAELSKYISIHRPEWNVRSAITRAYRAVDRDKDGFIRRLEFPSFYRLITSYTKFWDPNRKITRNEFTAVAWKLGIHDADGVFTKLDTEGKGYILMVDFTNLKEELTTQHGNVRKFRTGSSRRRRDSIELSVSSTESDTSLFPMDMYDTELREAYRDILLHIADDGNNVISLKDLENYIRLRRPKWYHKPAMIHAVRAIPDPLADDSIHREDASFVLTFIMYYISFRGKYTTLDGKGDRRVSKRQLSRAARHLRLSNVDELFTQLDPDGNGHVLFDTLCTFCAQQKLQTLHQF